MEEEFEYGKGKKSREENLNLSGKAKSSINFKAVKSNSEKHNARENKLDYVFKDLTKNNESWVEERIHDRFKKIQESCKKLSGRALYKNATPIREAVVNLNSHHTMKDVKKMTDALEKKFKIKAFQIHIHRDEGKSKNELNHHAHIVLDWQDKTKGSMIRLNKLAMSKIQTLVADELGMERGKEGSKSIRLEAQVYKQTQEVKKLQRELKNANLELSEKKTLISLKNLKTEFCLDKSELVICRHNLKTQPKLKEQLQTTRQKLEQQEMKNNQLKAPLEQLRNRLKPLQMITKDLEMKLNELKKILEKRKTILIAQKKKLVNYLKPNSKSLELAKRIANKAQHTKLRNKKPGFSI